MRLAGHGDALLRCLAQGPVVRIAVGRVVTDGFAPGPTGIGGMSCGLDSCADEPAKHTAARAVLATITCTLRRVTISGGLPRWQALRRPHGEAGLGDRDVELLGRYQLLRA